MSALSVNSIFNLILQRNKNKSIRLYSGQIYEVDSNLAVCIEKYDNSILFSYYGENYSEELLTKTKEYFSQFTIFLHKRRNNNWKVVQGSFSGDYETLTENGLKFTIWPMKNRNTGFFADASVIRKYLIDESKDKKILNLFSYTCSLSVAAISGGARQVINVDMSKGALAKGRINHTINQIDQRSADFFNWEIFRSWKKISKKSPLDLIIIDPPSFQKNSFEGERDYLKLIEKINKIDTKEILLCCNSPQISVNKLLEITKDNFSLIKRLELSEEFHSEEPQRDSKFLVMKKNNI